MPPVQQEGVIQTAQKITCDIIDQAEGERTRKRMRGVPGSSASSSSSKGIAAIVGVGSNLGRSIARKFAHEGFSVAILSRDLGMLSRFADEIAREEKAQVFAIRIDCSDTRSIREAFEGVLSLGFVEILVYNAHSSNSDGNALVPTNFTDIRPENFKKSLSVSTVGPFHCAQQVMSGMVEKGRGTILFTGCSASLNGMAGFSQLCCGKFGLRGLSQCLAREFETYGIHVAHVVIDGVVGPPRGPSSLQRTTLLGEQQRQSVVGGGEGTTSLMSTAVMDPDVVAQTYWHLHIQDRAAWTHEIDLRPSTVPS
ncbi:hypothetical protein MLD38_028600 [Melastoma candidum]|uniref:Uncharacterized protein n=1 Tax=Melastoma candidum TaxID=119954 RepID=A0ACB9N397_9MYRT|nr:hypothetical protein MLD38_028600 [Melastoma candidum]